MRFRKKRLLALALCPWWLAGQTQLPEGPGKEATRKICSNCHDIETVTAARRTKIGWQQMVEDMAGRGAEGSDEELAAIVTYLATFYGKVNVNTASADELRKALGLSEKEALAIVSWREKNGKYSSFDQLQKTPGVDAEKLRDKRGLVAFSQ
jgi:competence ComEA-like helix-hairpin-helix protein